MNPPRTLRPTRAGWIFFAFTLGVGFAALNTGNNLLYLALSLMLAFLALSGFLSEATLRGIDVARELPREIFAGLPGRVLLHVSNNQRRVASLAIVIEDWPLDPRTLSRKQRRREPAGRCFALRVGGGERVTRSYPLVAERRGWTQLTGIRISTRFPFGLFVKARWVELPGELLVYPEIEPVNVPRGGAQTEREGQNDRGVPGQGAEVSQLREYHEGDSARHIHWRSSLRRGDLVVGEVEESEDAEIEILLRTAPDGPESAIRREAFEQRVRDAASEVVAHLDAGLRVALRTDHDRLAPAAGTSQRTRLLSFLALVARAPVNRVEAASAPLRRAERAS